MLGLSATHTLALTIAVPNLPSPPNPPRRLFGTFGTITKPANLITPLPAPFSTRQWSKMSTVPHSSRPPSEKLYDFKSDPSFSSSLELLRVHAPALDGRSYKGQSGKIAVIGGSLEYTGAPYFAAMAAFRAGAELVFVYCAAEAAAPIKMYSPDLIVYPGFQYLGDECENLDRVHAVVIGPGLGRRKEGGEVVEKVLKYAKAKGKRVVVDADALWWIGQREEVREVIRGGIKGNVYLTPNKVEMGRLMEAMGVEGGEEVVRELGHGVVVVEKGKVDKIWANGVTTGLAIGIDGSLKRCGGLGDILSGLISVCAAWIEGKDEKSEGGANEVAPAVCGCLMTRMAAHRAFAKWGRSLVASDVLPFVGEVVDEVIVESDNGNKHG